MTPAQITEFRASISVNLLPPAPMNQPEGRVVDLSDDTIINDPEPNVRVVER